MTLLQQIDAIDRADPTQSIALLQRQRQALIDAIYEDAPHTVYYHCGRYVYVQPSEYFWMQDRADCVWIVPGTGQR